MNFQDLSLTTSDVIQLISISVALIIGVISIVISVIALWQNASTNKKSNMAQIEIFPLKLYGDTFPRIRIQNFGNTTGRITDIKTIPEMPECIFVNPFCFYKDMSLAPGQQFTTIFVREDKETAQVPIEVFDVIIKYKTLGKTIKSTYHINFKFIDGIVDTESNSEEYIKILKYIHQSIQGLQ